MKFKTQTQVLDKLEDQTRKALRKTEDELARGFVGIWDQARLDLAATVMREYRRDFPRGVWDIVQAEQRGTLRRIRRAVYERMGHFRDAASSAMRAALRQLYRAELERAVWMLDSTTPDHVVAAVPNRTREAAAPQDYAAGWQEALDGWIQAYEDTLAANLRLEALHEGGLEDAADEVDATKIGGSVPANKFQSLFTNQSLIAMQDARDDVAAANGGAGNTGAGAAGLAGYGGVDEIWMTMEDAAVCPICDAYDGKPYQDVGDDIPAHFNCRCFTRLVPAKWADLLRSGDADAKDLALRMDADGLVKDAMAVRGAGGEIAATFAVPFEKWLQGRGATVYNMSISGGR